MYISVWRTIASRQYLFFQLSKKAPVSKFRAEPLYSRWKIGLGISGFACIFHCLRLSSYINRPLNTLFLSYPREFRERSVSAPIEKASPPPPLRERERERVSVIRRPFSRTGNRRPGIEINLYSALKGGGGVASSRNRKVDRSRQVNFRDTIDVVFIRRGRVRRTTRPWIAITRYREVERVGTGVGSVINRCLER